MWKTRPVLFLFLLTFGIYFFSFFNQFVWDDEQFIYRNQYVQQFDVKKIFSTNTIAGAGEVSNYYRPLTTLSFAIDYQIWGTNTFGYHLVNTLLHIGAGIVLYKLLLKLKINKGTSFITALIFLIHPIQTEAVTYMNSRGDSLYSFLLILSLYLLTHLLQQKKFTIQLYEQVLKIPNYLLSILLVLVYLCSILSKEIALAGLGLHALIILRHYFLKPEKIWMFFSNQIWPIISFLLSTTTVLIYLALRSSVLNFQNTFNFFDDTSLYSESLFVRLLTFLKIIFIYLKLFFIPFPLHMERSTEIISNPFNGWLFCFVLLMIGLAYLSYYQWKKSKKLTILFGWAWSAIMLVPVSGIIAINGLLYEHWLYLPLIGFSIIICETLLMIWPKIGSTVPVKYFIIFAIIILSILTIRQNYFWSTPIRLYTYLLQHTESGRIHNNLAMAYSDTGEYEKAITHYQAGLAWGVEYPQIYHNLGNTYVAVGELKKAEQSFEKALELNPAFFHTYTNLISLHVQNNNFDSAIAVATLAQEQYPAAAEYQVLELQILLAAKDKQGFDEKKSELLQKYSTDLEVRNYVNSLQFTQE